MQTKFYNLITVLFLITSCAETNSQNRDPLAAEIITSDLDNFWAAYQHAGPNVNPKVLEDEYLKIGSKGVRGFTPGRIKNAENLANVIKSHYRYYSFIKPSTDSIAGMKEKIRTSLVKLKEIFPDAVFPPIYFVIGAMNSGGTTSRHGLIIGAEMYAMTPQTPKEELGKWHMSVLKPVRNVPEIVAHELIHFQQRNLGSSLLAACIKEGSADFIGELISGSHINQHVHDYANAREKELWLEFQSRSRDTNYKGWLYTSAKDRPNDLGYWIGYKITKAYYEKASDKKVAIRDILNVKNAEDFLEKSGYGKDF
jgi:hypothetical protein